MTSRSTWATRIAWSFLVKNTGTTTITNLVGQRPDRRGGDLPGHDLGAGCIDDLHRDDRAPDHSGRRGCGRCVATPRPRRARTRRATTSRPTRRRRDTPVAQAPALQLTKSAAVTDVNADGKTDLGDTIAWSFLVKNTGTTTITNLTVTDPTAGAGDLPGHDVGAGSIDDLHGELGRTPSPRPTWTAVSSATPRPRPARTPRASTCRRTRRRPTRRSTRSVGLSLVKSAAVTDMNNDGRTDLGDTIQWSFLVTNTGTATIDRRRGD